MTSSRCGQAAMKFQVAQVTLKVSPFLQLTYRYSFGNSLFCSPLPSWSHNICLSLKFISLQTPNFHSCFPEAEPAGVSTWFLDSPAGMCNGYCEAASIPIASLPSVEFQAVTMSGQAGHFPEHVDTNTFPHCSTPLPHALEPALWREQGFSEDWMSCRWHCLGWAWSQRAKLKH